MVMNNSATKLRGFPLVLEEIVPDWTEYWTIAKTQEELSRFVFQGVGWYPFINEGVMLVQETDVPSGAAIEPDPHRFYRFSIWNSVDIREAWKALLELPVKEVKQ